MARLDQAHRRALTGPKDRVCLQLAWLPWTGLVLDLYPLLLVPALLGSEETPLGLSNRGPHAGASPHGVVSPAHSRSPVPAQGPAGP